VLFDAKRLTALHEAALLDVPPPADLQRLTTLLARQLNAPMATVTIVDADRQYFLASIGLPESLAATRQTPLPGAFCKHVLLDGAPLLIPNVAAAEQFAHYEMIRLANVGCYLGAPITTSDGTRVGAMCVMAHEPRDWGEDEVAVVQDYANLAADLIEARLIRVREMQERTERLDILTRITEGFVTLDRAWRVKFVNAMAAALARCTPAEAEGRTLWELLPPLESADMGRWLREIQDEPGVYEREWKGVANPGWFEIRAVVSHDGISLYIRDIASRKHAEQALVESEARYRQLTYFAPVGIFECDAAGSCTYLNQRALEMMGIELHQALGDGWAMAVHPDDRPSVFGEWQAAAQGLREFRSEYRYRRPDGSQRWAVGRATATHSANGDVSGFIGTVSDITEIKNAEDELRRVNERFSHALAGSDIGLWDWDVVSGRVLFSDRLLSMLGYAHDDFLPHVDEWSSRVHPDDFPKQANDRWALAAGVSPAHSTRGAQLARGAGGGGTAGYGSGIAPLRVRAPSC
jgi:PAS domain S-box-containing protein